LKALNIGAPMLETGRLTLRAHRADDLDAVAALWSDEAVVRHITGKPSTREECWARLLRYAGLWPLKGYGYWAVVEKASGRFAGEVGIADFARELDPPQPIAPEAGWVVAPWAQGKGYATEAMQAILAWADAALGRPHTYCMLDATNAPSVRVAEKCGYRELGRVTYKTWPTLLYRR
jgi:RimJ/RimL family protein N-acetyltransferase